MSTPRNNSGFSLAELLVATVMISVVMGAVYVLFNTTLRAWKLAGEEYQADQTARLAFAKMEHEIENIFYPANHLFEGEEHEVTMFVIVEPMNVGRDVAGPHLMQVSYRINRGKGELIREEALVDAALPPRPNAGFEVERSRIKLKRKEDFTIAEEVESFRVQYLWVPEERRDRVEPPEWQAPVPANKHSEGWGLPHALQITLELKDPRSASGAKTYSARIPIRVHQNPKSVEEIAYMVGNE